MKKGYGKIIFCVIAAVLLVAAASFALEMNRDVDKRVARVRAGTEITVTLEELPKGSYSSDTENYKWRYFIEFPDEEDPIYFTTIGTYSREKLLETNYEMNVRFRGKTESMEVPYLESYRSPSYVGPILLYCLVTIPLLIIVWILTAVRLDSKLRKEGTLAYGRFVSADREGSYYKITYEFEIDGATVKRRSKAVYTMDAVQAYKEMGIFEIRYRGRRSVISQTLLAVKL